MVDSRRLDARVNSARADSVEGVGGMLRVSGF